MARSSHRRAPELRRRGPKVPARPQIVVVCEGARTEVEYLGNFRADHGHNLIRLETIGGAGTPDRVVGRAIESRRILVREAGRKNANSYDKEFSVWAMFDIDEHPDVRQARERAAEAGVNVAVSNPCIELWALLHFLDSDRPLHRREAQATLHKFMPKYDHDANPCFEYGKMREHYTDAVRRSRIFIRRREEEGSPLGNPCSTVHDLLEDIRQSCRAPVLGTEPISVEAEEPIRIR